jgi:hypothetical protein
MMTNMMCALSSGSRGTDLVMAGVDGSVCLLNYREDGTTFWNQFFIAALRGADGNIVNYVGVQCKVSEEYAKEVRPRSVFSELEAKELG